MNLKENQVGNVSIVSLEDARLDASIAPEFKQQMEVMIAEGKTNIILDISKLKFMDSSSLGAMVGVLKTLGNPGKTASCQGEMVVVGASGVVLELFKLTRMDRVFNLADDLKTAEQHFLEAV